MTLRSIHALFSVGGHGLQVNQKNQRVEETPKWKDTKHPPPQNAIRLHGTVTSNTGQCSVEVLVSKGYGPSRQHRHPIKIPCLLILQNWVQQSGDGPAWEDVRWVLSLQQCRGPCEILPSVMRKWGVWVISKHQVQLGCTEFFLCSLRARPKRCALLQQMSVSFPWPTPSGTSPLWENQQGLTKSTKQEAAHGCTGQDHIKQQEWQASCDDLSKENPGCALPWGQNAFQLYCAEHEKES